MVAILSQPQCNNMQVLRCKCLEVPIFCCQWSRMWSRRWNSSSDSLRSCRPPTVCCCPGLLYTWHTSLPGSVAWEGFRGWKLCLIVKALYYLCGKHKIKQPLNFNGMLWKRPMLLVKDVLCQGFGTIKSISFTEWSYFLQGFVTMIKSYNKLWMSTWQFSPVTSHVNIWIFQWSFPQLFCLDVTS